MANHQKESSAVVKIDPKLLEMVEEFIKKEDNKFKFANKKQFIDIAVHDFLQKEKKRMENGKKE